MDPKLWGPGTWQSMFYMAANYTPNKAALYKKYFEILGDMLPCKYCRDSYAQYIQEIPIQRFLDSDRSMIMWVYLIKDKVNKKLMAQEQAAAMQEVRQRCSRRSLCQQHEIDAILKKHIYTQPSPPFEEIYEKYRRRF